MRKIKKLFSIGLAVLFMLATCLCLTGCAVDPYALDTWYLVGYVDENGNGRSVGYDNITATNLYSDDITIRYFEDKTFIFKEFDKEYTGTYTYKRGKKETSVSLTFSDGTKGTGTCAIYGFDGTWHEGTLQVFGKEYNFSGEWEESWGRKEYTYNDVGEVIFGMIQKGKTRGDWALYKGEVERRGEEFWFVPCNVADINEQNLSQAYELYTYEVAEDYSVERGDNTLREGECFINYKYYQAALDSENFEIRNRYAVWYYDDVFRKLYPWTAEVEQEDVLSIRAEYREDDLRAHYYVQIWEQGSVKLQKFYELFLSNTIVANAPPLRGVNSTITYHIKVTDQTHEVVLQSGWTEDGGYCQGFVADGRFYRIYADKQLDAYLNGDRYYALEKNEEGAKLFIGDEYVKTYNDLLEDVLFIPDFQYEEGSSEYVLTFGDESLILLDEKHFIWQGGYYGKMYCEVVGDVDFSVIFEEIANRSSIAFSE